MVTRKEEITWQNTACASPVKKTTENTLRHINVKCSGKAKEYLLLWSTKCFLLTGKCISSILKWCSRCSRCSLCWIKHDSISSVLSVMLFWQLPLGEERGWQTKYCRFLFFLQWRVIWKFIFFQALKWLFFFFFFFFWSWNSDMWGHFRALLHFTLQAYKSGYSLKVNITL